MFTIEVGTKLIWVGIKIHKEILVVTEKGQYQEPRVYEQSISSEGLISDRRIS